MSNVRPEDIFNDEMNEIDRNPPLPQNGEFLLELVDFVLDHNDVIGAYVGAEFKVLESNHPEAPVGSIRFKSITQLDHPNKKTRKVRKDNVRKMLAPIFGKDPSDQNTDWAKICVFCANKPESIRGRKVRARTGGKTPVKNNPQFHWIPIEWNQA